MAANKAIPNDLRIFNNFWRYSFHQEVHITAIYNFLDPNFSPLTMVELRKLGYQRNPNGMPK